MTDDIQDQRDAFKEWATQQLEHAGEYVRSMGLIGTDAKASGEWALPEHVFLARIWAVN